MERVQSKVNQRLNSNSIIQRNKTKFTSTIKLIPTPISELCSLINYLKVKISVNKRELRGKNKAWKWEECLPDQKQERYNPQTEFLL